MQSFFLYANTGKPETLPAADRFARSLLSKGQKVFLDQWLHDELALGEAADAHHLPDRGMIAVCFGGDGTLLRILPALVKQQVPVLGVNMGHTGFLMETSADSLEHYLEPLINKQYAITSRAMLSCAVNGNEASLAMNELALTRGNNPSSLVLDVHFDCELIYTIHGDGVLVSSPTGTTGYCLSAGGPVLHPDTPCHVVVPVCSHIMHQRPVVLPDTGTITLSVRAQPGSTHQINLDGQIVMNLDACSKVTVQKASMTAGFIRFEPPRFLTRLHQKQMEWSNHIYGGTA